MDTVSRVDKVNKINKKPKNFLSFAFFFCILMTLSKIFSQTPSSGVGTPLQKRFVAGNLTEKTQVLKSATALERDTLCKGAITFCISYLPLFGAADKDLITLATTAVETIDPTYIKETLDPTAQESLLNSFYCLYTQTALDELKIAILEKLSVLNQDSEQFKDLLNKQLKDSSVSAALREPTIKALGALGDKDSWNMLFGQVDSGVYKGLEATLMRSLKLLAQKPRVEIASFIAAGSVSQCKKIFDICMTPSGQDTTSTQVVYFMANIAENILSRTVYIAENSSTGDADLIPLQFSCYRYLVSQKWTRATRTATRYFSLAEKFYTQKRLSDEQFCSIVDSLPLIAPLDCVGQLSTFLSNVNKQKDTGFTAISDRVLISVINVLGRLGDKGAFDTLLSVTYCDYSGEVLDAAKKSLAKLKW